MIWFVMCVVKKCWITKHQTQLSIKNLLPTETKHSFQDENEINQIQNKMLYDRIPTAYSTHKHCLICKKTKGLHVLKKESLMYAYTYHGILIKKHARSCDDH